MFEKKGDLNTLKIVDFGLSTEQTVEKSIFLLIFSKIFLPEMWNSRLCCSRDFEYLTKR
jgi:hypothetical protein